MGKVRAGPAGALDYFQRPQNPVVVGRVDFRGGFWVKGLKLFPHDGSADFCKFLLQGFSGLGVACRSCGKAQQKGADVKARSSANNWKLSFLVELFAKRIGAVDKFGHGILFVWIFYVY